jgi:hypothetical protein
MKSAFLLVLFLLSAVLTSCTSATTTATPDAIESPLSLSPLVVQEESPVVTPPPPAPTPSGDLPVPTQDPQMGSIEGSVTMQGYPPGTFLATLYLGDPTGANPVGAYISLDIETAVRGYVRPDGTFVFPNVPPGTYAILAWTPGGAYIVPDPSGEPTWLIEVSESSRFDTGHILVPAFSTQD